MFKVPLDMQVLQKDTEMSSARLIPFHHEFAPYMYMLIERKWCFSGQPIQFVCKHVCLWGIMN